DGADAVAVGEIGERTLHFVGDDDDLLARARFDRERLVAHGPTPRPPCAAAPRPAPEFAFRRTSGTRKSSRSTGTPRRERASVPLVLTASSRPPARPPTGRTAS